MPQPASDEDLANLEIDWAFRSELVQISRYQCQARCARVTGEQRQPAHVIGFPHRGAFLHHEQGTSTVLAPTDILFLNAHRPYLTSHPYGFGDSGSALVLRPDLLLEAVREHSPEVEDAPDRPFPGLNAPSSARLYMAQRLLLTEIVRFGQWDQGMVEEAALAVAARALRAGFAVWSTRPRRPRYLTRAKREAAERIEAVRRAIASDFARSQPLAQLAERVGVSVFHLCRSFRAETGLTIFQYRNRLRLRAAVERLDAPCPSLTDLALDLGFSSHSHFTAVFRSEFGTTPRAVRDSSSVRSDLSRLLDLGAR